MEARDSGSAAAGPTNRLIEATSPYLLQHAHNPVDWYEWGPEAMARAQAEDKPILLSIGYAACHWCHVMAHESFEDADVAGIMNAHFVCVKVDREERPDLDAIYMDAVQAMTGSGGWPMTVFLTPDGEPFFAGTYFPPEDRHGLPGFRRLLMALAETWRDRREELSGQGKRVAAAIAQVAARSSDDALSERILEGARAALAAAFDEEWGGFGRPPKFPQPTTLEFLLRAHLRGSDHALTVVTKTLDRMAAGGMCDHLGGGFHRYSTDRRWFAPHFEKMLYDNAQLARVYVHALQLTGNDRYRDVAIETLDYLLREMRHPEGGFFSSQDADSEGREGTFYVWSFDELVAAAGPNGEKVAREFGATPEGNWEHGSNILWQPSPDERVPAEVRRRLFDARRRRIPPATDDKILTAWNGLAIHAFAEAGRALDEPRYVAAAADSLAFVRRALVVDGRLQRAWREGRVSGPGYLDDYASLAAGAMGLYQATFDLDVMKFVRTLADDMIRLFSDQEHGGFFQTGSDAERLVFRPKELFDNALPSGNSAAADVLLRLALLTGEDRYEQAAASALRAAAPFMERAPSALGHALGALDLYLSNAKEVAIVGDPNAEETRALADVVWKRYAPNLVLAAGRPGDDWAAEVVPLLADRTAIDDKPTAYVCERFVCKLPLTDPGDLAAQLFG